MSEEIHVIGLPKKERMRLYDKWRYDNGIGIKRDPVRRQETCKKYYDSHHEQALAAEKKWRDEHKEEFAKMTGEWSKENSDARNCITRNYRARKRSLEGVHTTVDINAIFKAQNGLCYYCGEPLEEYDVDHKQPVTRGGSNWPENLCCACVSCNRSKGNKTEAEYLARMTR
jgi:5-methylcytosine-specific restriction endonuclease McrA